MKSRRIKRIFSGTEFSAGAGVRLIRYFDESGAGEMNPFLLFEVIDSDNPEDYVRGFPWHQHKGMEEVTYLLEGRIEYSDSMGNDGRIEGGGCRWTVAGSGIMHREMPQPSPRMRAARLWISMPARKKTAPPADCEIWPEMIPVIEKLGVKVSVVSGEYNEVRAPRRCGHARTTCYDVEMDSGARWEIYTPPCETLFVHVFSGVVSVCGRRCAAGRAALLSAGGKLEVVAGKGPARFILFSASPLKEAAARDEELRRSFAQSDDGCFV